MKNFLKTLSRKIRHKPELSCESEVYVLSYPKCGRTWLRALIGKYLSLKYNLAEKRLFATDTLTSRSGLSKTTFTHDGASMSSRRAYREFSYDRQKYQDKKIILLGRDIKDTLVSAYFHATKRINVFEGTISEFIATEEFGVLKLLAFYEVWLRNQHVPQEFVFIRYEEMHQDARNVLRKVLHFIGEDQPDEQLLAQSVEYCRFDNLRKLETQNKFNNNALKAKNLADQNSYKVRQGRVGGYWEHLSETDLAFIDEVIAKRQFDFGKFGARKPVAMR